MDVHDTQDNSWPGPLSRRRFLQAAGVSATVTAVGVPPAVADPTTATTLSLTAATGGSATLSPAVDRLVAEIQNVLWSVPRGGGAATALTSPGLEPTRPQFSPDGSRLVVCAYRGGGFHLWTLRPDGSDLRRLTDGPWDDRGPAWSPDGTRIAFASERGGDTVTGSPYGIWTVDVRNGELRRLTDGTWEDFDPTWSADGERVLFVRATVTPTGTLRADTIASVPADGSGPVTVEHRDDSGAQLMTPAVAPDGRLAYLRTTPAPTASCTLVVAGAPVAVDGDVLPAPPRWTDGDRLLLAVNGHFRVIDPEAPAAGEEIAFTATMPLDRPRYRSKAYDFDGFGTRPVRSLHLPALAPDGRSVAFAALNALWTAGTEGGHKPRKILQVPPTRYVSGPAWTPDGKGLVYADDRDGLFAVRRRDLDTGHETLLAPGGRVFPALSPDGTRLACLDMSGNLVVRDLPDGAERTLAAPLGAGGLPGRPSWSPDGRYVALCDRNRLNQRFREGYNLIRVVDTTTGTAALHALAPHTSLADRYDSGPVWSPDGRWMAVIAESALWLLPVRADGTPDGEPRRLTTDPADHPSWSADSRTLLHLSAGALRLLDIRSGKSRTVRVPLDYRRPRPADTVVHAGRFWDGTGPGVREDIDVLIRDGRIAEVVPHRGDRPAAHRVDASDRTVLPGLWDAHTHPWQTTYGGRQTALQLAYGITTAVSLGGFAYEQARIREAVTAGALAGPRLLATGELLDGARVAYSMGRAHRTPEGLRRSLARGAALDWDFVKTYVRAPGWIMNEAADFAHERLGVRSGSHLCTPGVQLGQDLTTHLQATQRLEFGHATTATGRSYEDVEQIYTEAGFHLVATPFTALALLGADAALAEDPRVTTLMPPWDTALVRQQAGLPPTADQLTTLDRELAIYRRILAEGGLVALGTDQPLVPVGLHLHLALRALHRGGLTPAEALRTATLLPARAFGADADLGTLEEGKLADLTIVDGDPFTDFDTLVRTTAVLRGGVLFEQKDLVDAFAPTSRRRADSGEEWLEVSRHMRREGCCDPATAL
ncbi:amidohydrolase family protein [Streptomyces sp. SID13726]|uniref:amidohydrolase family protein n=1 Tax=Streptomyces sp. SID13726 TaxID=2706058 RepID=UPI0013BA862B|nr:amidohydrolase family protein [Streptomyces sp. SID13726]NEA98724.1 amidohydrolase family protein [Streptomyces sp. SID13726]